MKIAIDLLWVKHKTMGGLESYVMNLLEGFRTTKDEHSYYLIVSTENEHVFKCFTADKRFTLTVCNVESSKLFKTVFWEFLHLDNLITKLRVDLCFVPYYRMPITPWLKNKYIITIHDLQALHFPEYFNRFRVMWMRFFWNCVTKKANKIIAISNFVKQDIIEHYNIAKNKTEVIYNPIVCDDNTIPFENIEDKYKIKKQQYYYTVSSTLKHKNLITLLKVMLEIRNRNLPLCKKFLISGVSGSAQDSLKEFIYRNKLEDICIFTGYISNEERNTLLANANMFLFASIFEGFGMPPIEAMSLGTKCITTRCTSIPEVTQEKAIYVSNPFDVEEWIKVMLSSNDKSFHKINFTEYSKEAIAQKYLLSFCNTTLAYKR